MIVVAEKAAEARKKERDAAYVAAKADAAKKRAVTIRLEKIRLKKVSKVTAAKKTDPRILHAAKKTDPRILRAAEKSDRRILRAVAEKKKKFDSMRSNRLALVNKKADHRMIETAKRTAFQKEKLKNTARQMAAIRPPEPEKFDAESLLPRKIKNESIVDICSSSSRRYVVVQVRVQVVVIKIKK